MSRAERLRIGFVQTDPEFGRTADNLARAAELIAGAPEFDVLVLPELLGPGYSFRDRAELSGLAETADGPTVRMLRDAAQGRDAWLCGGFAERDGDCIYNAAALVGPAGEIHIYRKIHLFDRETGMFTPGSRPFQSFEIQTGAGSVLVGMMVCFDWFFPESMRSLALAGAEVILHPSNLVKPYCQDAMVTRCLENGVFSVTANRTGTDDRGDGLVDTFTGRSRIAGPRGRVLATASESGESVEVVEVDLRDARDKRITARNDLLGSRRPGMYRG
ncbi:MAG: acyltransferase [Gemmatimonadetes bacterium]|nr:acyltransferase [Gemmatimonadota bacterium]